MKSTDFEISGLDYDVKTTSLDDFFVDRNNGTLRPGVLPIPDGVDRWLNGTYKGFPVWLAYADHDLFVIADTQYHGFAMLHYEAIDETNTSFRSALKGGIVKLCNTKGDIFMSNNPSVMDVVQRYQQNPAMGNMNLQNPSMNPGFMAPGFAGAESITAGGVDVKRLQATVRVGGYVAGYVMNSAPNTSMALVNVGDKKEPKYTIVARESKPSTVRGVCISLPARCVLRNGTLAAPNAIRNGDVDFNTVDKNERVNVCWGKEVAIAYIDAFGQRLPEYAPFVADAREQWSAEDILGEKPEVTYVTMRSTKARPNSRSGKDNFAYALRTTASGRGLFTRKNIMCLRGLKHIAINCDNETEEFQMNENAFGLWRYRTRTEAGTGAKVNVLRKALSACPTQLWERDYDIVGEDGQPKTVKGLGSVYFHAGSTVKLPDGKEVPGTTLSYTPWYGASRGRGKDKTTAIQKDVKYIVARKFRAATGKGKDTMVSTTLTLASNPGDRVFSDFSGFYDYAINNGFISREKVAAWCKTSSSSSVAKFGMGEEDTRNLRAMLTSNRNVVYDELNAAMTEFANRSTLSELTK